jgi:glutaminyl-peptide cyclotransferase
MRISQFNSRQVLKSLLLLFLAGSASTEVAVGNPAKAEQSTVFRGSSALSLTRRATAFGERPSGSEAIAKTRDWIVAQLKPLQCQITVDSFTGHTPAGPIPMANVIARFPGTSGKSIVVSGHYDTKKIPMVQFVGANDAGSSTGFLLEFAHVLATLKHSDDIILVFFDGEEALGQWTDTDSCYGSRHLVDKWASDGTLARVKALINVDMIGDKDLDLSNDSNSSASLRKQMGEIAARLGYTKFIRTEAGGIEDDHKPFGDSGVNVLDVIDLDYGPGSSYWHTAQDTVDKLSAHSFQVVGDLVLELVKTLDKES